MPYLTGERLRTLVGTEELDYTLLKSTLAHYKQPRNKITQWLTNHTLVRVKKGLYVFGADYARTPYCGETLANLIYGPSAISVEYALSFYGLIPERVAQITSVTVKKNKYFHTPIGTFTYQHLPPQKYSVGVTQYYLNETHPILIATPEKALADYFYCHHPKTIFKTLEHMLSFLKQDLRVDNESLLKFNTSLLTAIQAQYRLPALDWILKIIQEGVYYE